jgi:hypothetical protein
MNREATENLRLDRRLLNRRGWISKAEREKEFAALPDVSQKIAPPDEESSAGESGDAAATEPPRAE